MTTQVSRGVIFDLDGVLVDTADFHRQSWQHIARKLNITMTDDFFISTFGMQNDEIIPMWLQKDLPREEIDTLADWKEKRYRELLAGKLTLMGGVRELLNDLKENDFLLAVGSSAPRLNVECMLSQAQALDYFNILMTGDDISCGKPAPDTFLHAAEELSLPPNACVVVEDAVQGVQAGKAAGMTVIAVTTTRKRDELTQADIVIDSLSELNASDFIRLLPDTLTS